MAQCKVDHLIDAFEEICNTVGKETELVNSSRTKIHCLRESFNSPAITYCMEKYINAELDYKTLGDRGLGRASAYIPRLAAYFRKQISALSYQEIDEIYYLIQDLILRGYIVHVLFIENTLGTSTVSDGKELFEGWVPGIYAESPSQMSMDMQKAFTVCTDSAITKIKSSFRKHNMKGGGFLSKDKTDEILMYYPFAGFGLRFEETRK